MHFGTADLPDTCCSTDGMPTSRSSSEWIFKDNIRKTQAQRAEKNDDICAKNVIVSAIVFFWYALESE